MINLMQLASMAKKGENPMPMLEQMARNNPRLQTAMQYIIGKTPQQHYEVAKNMARGMGTTPEEIAHRLGLM